MTGGSSMVETFEHRDLSDSVFHFVELRRAVFDDVNLADATIHNADLADLLIDEAYIRGLTINGIEVEPPAGAGSARSGAHPAGRGDNPRDRGALARQDERPSRLPGEARLGEGVS